MKTLIRLLKWIFRVKSKYVTVGQGGDYRTVDEATEAGEKHLDIK